MGRPPKGTKELWRMMGEERLNNELILKQYGIIALAGGMLKHRHFEVMRLAIGRHCDSNKKKTWAIYRVDAPYKPITDHGTGKRMGGGATLALNSCQPASFPCPGCPLRAVGQDQRGRGKIRTRESKSYHF